ncbi:MAG: PAS domain-containing protein [Paludibacter sp.]|jgi:hypothetical protein|nr:PAS domain-containing protein [Paludibacter sp.]
MISDQLDNKLSHQSIFQWMPTCALVIDAKGNIQEVNHQAIQFFKASTKEDFIFDKQNIKNMIIDFRRATELIDLINKNKELINKEILIRRFDKTIASVDLNASVFPDNPNFILIQFTETYTQSQEILNELSEAFRHEANRLKPYLNKPGKDLLEEIIVNNILDSITTNKATRTSQPVDIGDERMHQLTKLFPELSKNELIHCGYLSLKMSTNNISKITGKTPNSLRVAFHRILQKTTVASGKELIRILEAIPVES